MPKAPVLAAVLSVIASHAISMTVCTDTEAPGFRYLFTENEAMFMAGSTVIDRFSCNDLLNNEDWRQCINNDTAHQEIHDAIRLFPERGVIVTSYVTDISHQIGIVDVSCEDID